MADQMLPSQAVLNQFLRYEPDTGKLYWRERTDEMFTGGDDRTHTVWNSRYAGKEAFITPNEKGYLYGSIHKQKMKAHRVIWKMVTGEEPDQIDHINGDTADNRWENLRDVEGWQNQRNMKRPKNNTSGQIGVSWDSARSLWAAEIWNRGKKHALGRFESFDDAVAARKAAQERFGFHPNHGR